jgi:hypothetical protein
MEAIMETKSANLLIPVILNSVDSKTYTFQEITEPLEMEKLFGLRYKVYSECELAPFLAKNEYHIDMEVYDLHSRFFGIYCSNELVSGVRAVHNKRDYFNYKVFEIGHKFNLYSEDKDSQAKLENLDYPDFPFLSYPEVPQEIKQFYEDQRKDRKVYMSNRCVIDTNHRGLKTIQLLTEEL